MQCLIRITVVILALVSMWSEASAAIVLGAENQFQSGNTEGWRHGFQTQFSPMLVQDAGPAGTGDHALTFSSSGGNGAGSRFIALNAGAVWTGDYLSAGVNGFRLDVDNNGPTDLNLRIGLRGPGGDFVTASSFVSADPSQGWRSLVFSVRPSDLIHVTGPNNVATTLGSVTEIEVLSAVTPIVGQGGIPAGDIIVASALFDNITAVSIPEPGSALLLGTAMGIAALTRKRSRRA